MDYQAQRILLSSILEVQECLHEQYDKGEYDILTDLWRLQREKARRLRDGNYYTRPHSPGTTTPDK
jgi:hypothetical protein